MSTTLFNGNIQRNIVDPMFDKESRYISIEASIYFGGPDRDPLDVTKDNYLEDMDILEELSADTKNPIGNISSNELSFTLYNEADIFNPKNAESPYYGQIKQGLRIVTRGREDLSDQDTCLGTYYVTSWSAGLFKGTANIDCTDRLGTLLKIPMPYIDVHQDENIYTFFARVFKSLGLSEAEFQISESLKLTYLPFTYSIKGTVGENLQKLSTSFMCNIFTNRYDQIEVLPVIQSGTSVMDFSIDNQIINMDLEQTFLKTFTGATLTYALPYINDVHNVLSVPNYNLSAGHNIINNLEPNEGPIVSYAYANIENAIKSRLFDAATSPWDITLYITNNNTSSEQVNINVGGRCVVYNKAIISYADTTVDIENIITVETEFVQTLEFAQNYINLLRNYVSSDIPFIEVEARGNISLDLGSIVLLKDVKHNLEFLAKVYRAKYKYTGALSCTYTFLNLTDLGGEV